jgi:hypothetical protein
MKELEATRERAEESEAHNKIIRHRMAELQHALATKAKPRAKKFRLENPMVATDEGMEMLDQKEKEEREEELMKARRENERNEKKEQRDAERAKLSDLTLFKVSSYDCMSTYSSLKHDLLLPACPIGKMPERRSRTRCQQDSSRRPRSALNCQVREEERLHHRQNTQFHRRMDRGSP